MFENTSEVIQAENFLKSWGWDIQVKGPPPGIQSGCDLIIVFPLMEKLIIMRQLTEAGLPPIEMVPVTDPLLKPVDLFQVKDFGDYLMVRAANMKLTVEKKNRQYCEYIRRGVSGCPVSGMGDGGKTPERSPPARKDRSYPVWLCPGTCLSGDA